MEELSELFPKGQRLGKYQLIRRLAVGGMAEIYLAQASGLEGFEKLIVIKRILPQHALDPQLRRMFLDEARLMATLTHPHITQVYDVGNDGDAPFFAMEYVHGANLREIMHAAARASGQDHAARELPLQHALAILTAAAAGLHFAHEQTGPKGEPLHIVHRDVSPSNVLVTYGGSVKVSDFGIAKWSSQRTQTQEGALKGKFAYMSPEQCRGVALDRRSDVFALGTLLYELTTGNPPFRAASDYEILNRIVNGELPPPTLADGAVPARARAHRAARAGAGARRSLPDGAGAATGPGGVRARRGAGAVDGRGRRVHAHAVRASHRRVAARAAVGQVAEATPGRGRGGVGAPGGVVAADRHRPERADRGAAAAAPARTGARGGGAVAGARGRRDRGAASSRFSGGAARARRARGRARRRRRRRAPTPTPTPTPTGENAGAQSPTVAEAAAGKASTAPRAGNTVESHFEPSSTPAQPKPKRAQRPRAADPDVETPAPEPAAAAPAPAPTRSNALKTWDPDSPIPP